ncbi:MAG: 50S ribosomal protein L23 [Patescibacteria group bacterium]
MALFSPDTKKTTKTSSKTSTSGTLSPAMRKALTHEDGRLSGVLKAPWFSEKALIGTERGVYVFEVPGDATKPQIAAAISKFYNVTPKKVRIANLPAKNVSLRGRRGQGTRARRHKAYVYLKAGDTIALV